MKLKFVKMLALGVTICASHSAVLAQVKGQCEKPMKIEPQTISDFHLRVDLATKSALFSKEDFPSARLILSVPERLMVDLKYTRHGRPIYQIQVPGSIPEG